MMGIATLFGGGGFSPNMDIGGHRLKTDDISAPAMARPDVAPKIPTFTDVTPPAETRLSTPADPGMMTPTSHSQLFMLPPPAGIDLEAVALANSGAEDPQVEQASYSPRSIIGASRSGGRAIDTSVKYTGDKEARAFLESRGAYSPKLEGGRIKNVAMDQRVNPEFATRLARALADAEQATGTTARVGETFRPVDVQEVYYRRYLSGGSLAARPGRSRHQAGNAADIPRGKVLTWLHQNADRYGLEFLKGRAFERDKVHIQLKRGV